MNKKYFKLHLVLLIFIVVSTACVLPNLFAQAPEEIHERGLWEYEPVFSVPISVEVDQEKARLGSLIEYGVMVDIMEGAYELPVNVTLTTPASVPEIYTDEFMPFGAPIELSAGAAESRLDNFAVICYSTDISVFEREFEYGEIYGAYYNGDEWDYIKPGMLYLENGEGVACFHTYHLSLFGWGAIDAEERMEIYTHNAALAGYIQDQIDEKLEDTASNIVKHILTKNLGIDDESLQEKVMTSILLDDSWGDMVSNIKEGNPDAIEDIGLLAGRAIVMVVPDSTMKTALNKLTGDTGLSSAKVAIDVIHELSEGNYSDAAKKIVEGIADQFVVTTMAKIVVDGMEASIEYWKDEEVEAAYQAYKNGARGYFYGYNVDAGDFDAIWLQMRGLARQLELEAVNQQNEAREEIGYPLLTAEEEVKIREGVRINLKKEFMDRQKEEKELIRRQAEIKELIKLYDENSLLLSGVMGYRSEYEIEQRLDTLLHFKNKMMRDLGATELMDGVLLHNGKLGMDAVVRATLIYMEDGIEGYNEYIYDTFEVELSGDGDVEEESGEIEAAEKDSEETEVTVQKVTAVYEGPWHPYWEHECPDIEVIKLEAWNLGQAGGSETESVTAVWTMHNTAPPYTPEGERCTCDAEDKISVTTFTGVFSGGPNGTGELYLSGIEKVAYRFRFIDGSTVELVSDNYPEAIYTLIVENPEAFQGLH